MRRWLAYCYDSDIDLKQVTPEFLMEDITPMLSSILANTSLYKMLDGPQLAKVAAATSPLRMSPHCRVIHQGDAAEGAFWVVYGQVNVGLSNKTGGEKSLAILGPGKCFGLSEMLVDQPHLACVTTTVDTFLLYTSREAILQAAQDNVGFLRELMGCIGRQLDGLMRDIEAFSQSARQRLAGYLLRQSGLQTSHVVELVANKVLIASRLSLAPETLSRLFREFTEEGLIQIDARRIRILNSGALSAMIA